MQRNGSTSPSSDWLETLAGQFDDLKLRNMDARRDARERVRNELGALYGAPQPEDELLVRVDQDAEGLLSLGVPITESFEHAALVGESDIPGIEDVTAPLPPPPVLTFVRDVGWTTVLEFGQPAATPAPVQRRHVRGRRSLRTGPLRSFAG